MRGNLDLVLPGRRKEGTVQKQQQHKGGGEEELMEEPRMGAPGELGSLKGSLAPDTTVTGKFLARDKTEAIHS